MCTKIRETYSCGHSKVLPNSSNLLCRAKWEDAECSVKDKDMPIRIMDRNWPCRECAKEEDEWVEVDENEEDMEAPILGTQTGTKNRLEKKKKERTCVVM